MVALFPIVKLVKRKFSAPSNSKAVPDAAPITTSSASPVNEVNVMVLLELAPGNVPLIELNAL